MLVSLFVAEVVLLMLVIVDRWVDISPFNELDVRPLRVRIRATLVESAPVLAALAFTAVRFDPESAAALGLVPVAALSFTVATRARASLVPWWQGARAPTSEVHAFLEPRRAGGMVPSTFHCLQHAHATACVLMALVAVLAEVAER